MVHPDVDETPLSANNTERRNSLEKRLQARPDQQDLRNRHILLDTNVAPYVPAPLFRTHLFHSSIYGVPWGE